MAKRPARLTPMLEQYFSIKDKAEDALLFFRMGDFYEMFFDDAETAAPVLDLVLTARGKGGDTETPMCGIPYHSADQYIAKLVRHGFKVAICDQVEDPSQAKGLVKREIVRIITPGTAIDGSIVDREGNFLMSLERGQKSLGAAWLDVSTGEFFVTTYSLDDSQNVLDDITRFQPREILIRSDDSGSTELLRSTGISMTPLDAENFDARRALEVLVRHFSTQTVTGYGLEESSPETTAAGAALEYAASRYQRKLGHISSIRRESSSGTLHLDSSTIANLELFDSRDGGGSAATLWGVVNQTRTAPGTRLLRRWIVRPLYDSSAIFDRHDAIDELNRDQETTSALTRTLSEIADLERLAARISLRTVSPRELVILASSLESSGRLKQEMEPLSGPLLKSLRADLNPRIEISNLIRTTIEDEPSSTIRDGGVIASGVDDELDQLRTLAKDSKGILLAMERDERAATGIQSLKVRYNNVFGYYIEVSKANMDKVPDRYIRKQTLTNAERYITPELKEIEEKILGAEERSIAIELRLFDELVTSIAETSSDILETSSIVATVDVLTALSAVSRKRRWTRPSLTEERCLDIREGRHPVIETLTSERFIPNDTRASIDENGLQIITGPNMGGKSTYLRQIALIVLLNQIGSFVPASSARLGLFDRIFTRVGASDNLARGESTFMVEMHETANILNNATGRSLIILDEVGRGTATFDGLSLAWAIVEFLHDSGRGITFFATHYHEITDLASTRDRIANYSLAVREWNDQIIFLRKVVPGAADKSYGIQVARLAGVPDVVTERARELLKMLESRERDVVSEAAEGTKHPQSQLSLFDQRPAAKHPVIKELEALQVDTLSPIEALNMLHGWKESLD